MTQPAYGIIINDTISSPLPVIASDFSIIGILTTIDDANTATFPLDTPVMFNSSDPTMALNLGTGNLAQSVASINNQLAEFEQAAIIIAVCVPNISNLYGSSGQLARLVGDPNALTGLYAMKKAGALTGFIPRILICPGYTGQQAFSISAPRVSAGGSGYTSVPTITFTPTGATAVATLTAGAVTGVNMTAPGAYAPGTTVTAVISGGGGSGATFTFTETELANPVAAALPAVLQALLAMAFVADSGDGVLADSIAWRQTMSSDRLAPSSCWVVPGIVGAQGDAYTDGTAEAAGLQVAVDFQHDGLPGWSISGQQVNGILGLKNTYTFSLTDGATQGQELLTDQISVIEPGSIASDTAIAASGYVWAGVWNASTDPRSWFINKRRMKDYINLALIKAIRLRLGVDNVTPHSVQAVLNDMVTLGSYLVSRQVSIGFDVAFNPSENSPAQLQQGQFVVDFDSETPAPITQVTVNSSDDYQALVVELQTIISQSSTIAPQYIN